jgi:Ca-activated chloride channel family protein
MAANMNGLKLGHLVLLHPLWLAVALSLLIATLLLRVGSVASDWRRVLSAPMFDFLSGNTRRLSRVSIALLLASLTALALSKPVLRQSDDDSWRQSIGWVVVGDVSRSMTLDDTVPTRLDAMRQSMAELSRRAGARPVALIIFSGDAFLVAPPAFDRTVYSENAALLEHGVIPLEGSNLARALSLATAVIEDSQLLRARVLVLGDTGGISNSSLAAARHLADAGHRVDVLVFGTHDHVDAGLSPAGETAVDDSQAAALARAGNGRSVMANRFGVIDYESLKLNAQANASEHTDLQSLVWRQQAHWLLLLALPLMLMLFRQESRSG